MAEVKNLGKLNDFVTRYDGTNPALFRSFMNNFELGVKTLEIHITKQYLMLQNLLDGTPRDVAGRIAEQYERANPLILRGTDAQRSQHATRLLGNLKTELGRDPAVVGTKPTDKFLARWGTLTQGDDESVRIYYNRFIKLRDMLKKADPPEEFSEKQQFNTFIGQTPATGLLPPVQQHVRMQNASTLLGAGGLTCKGPPQGSTRWGRRTGAPWAGLSRLRPTLAVSGWGEPAHQGRG